MKKSGAERVASAIEDLSPVYREGDDGDAVRFSLDAVAAIIAEARSESLDSHKPLVSLLADTPKPGPSHADSVDRLYDLAQSGEYGDGLSDSDADEINDLVQDLYDYLYALGRRELRAAARRAKRGRG